MEERGEEEGGQREREREREMGREKVGAAGTRERDGEKLEKAVVTKIFLKFLIQRIKSSYGIKDGNNFNV